MSLQKVLKESKDPATGVSLYEHLKGVLAKLLFDNPSNALERFEEYSFELKGSKEEEVVFRVKESFKHLKDYEQRNKILLGKINTGSEEEPQEPATINYLPNIMDENKTFERVGVGIGEDEAYRVYKSLSKLVVKKNVKNVRFWGKILTSGSDYYIAEGAAEGGDEFPDMPADTEAKGTGINTLYYWATTQLSGDWSELPVVTPQQMRVSRKIKKILSGDLNAKVVSNPFFFGKEAHLLKCQILRITASSTVMPKGMYAPAEDTGEIGPVENWQADVRNQSRLQGWVHYPPAILKVGRLTLQKPENLEPQEEARVIAENEKKDPAEPRLKPLSQDKGPHSWKIGLIGEGQWRTVSKDTKPVNIGTIFVRSLTWPGWTTVLYLGRVSSLYVGYGFKAGQFYYPCEPERILEEQSDRQEVPQPI